MPPMETPLITLTTDFSEASPYVAVMKGVILSLAPSARIQDLTHRIHPQNIHHASYFLATAVPYYPPNTIHVCVVDPGVGTDRRPLMVRAGGQYLIAPDNGLLTAILRKLAHPHVHHITAEQYFRHPVSDTFHGRDIFAPVAAHLALGVPIESFGPTIQDWGQLPIAAATESDGIWHGTVQFIDDFGNVITNIPAQHLDRLPLHVGIGPETPHGVRWVRTYADASPGDLVTLFSSDGFLELAVVQGNAALRLGIVPGTPITVQPA